MKLRTRKKWFGGEASIRRKLIVCGKMWDNEGGRAGLGEVQSCGGQENSSLNVVSSCNGESSKKRKVIRLEHGMKIVGHVSENTGCSGAKVCRQAKQKRRG